jgi:signal transduction histidine kinase/CheY-like chemotaxis protein
MFPGSSVNAPTPPPDHSRQQEILNGQVRLLFRNLNLGIGVTVLACTILAAVQWRVASHPVVLGWWAYMQLVSLWRFVLGQRYRRAMPRPDRAGQWCSVFTASACLSGIGWGGAGFFLYAEARLGSQLFLIFVLGGMMLGAASTLASRPEPMLSFLIPTGAGPAIRLLLEGDETHVAMGVLAALFTIAVFITSRGVYRTIESSLGLRLENRQLIQELQAANSQAEALNRELELRVQQRTAQLHASAGQLRAEIAQREQIEEELLQARKLESLAMLAGGIAHDFNNFLTIVQGNIELAKAQSDPAGPVRETLEQTTSACRRAASLASQLLTFAKGGAPVRRVVDAAALINEAVQLARAGAPTTITVDLAADLGTVQVDSGQIGQVLHNILLNARQAMPEGGIVEVRAEKITTPLTGPCVRIAIRDFGAGIPPADLPRIFDPYFTTKPGGKGLGLATAYSIVAKHNGRISATSKPGEGTEITIELPASSDAAAPEPSEAPAIFRGAGRVLAMDDEEPLRTLLQKILRQLGYDVETARDGAEAIALYEQSKSAGKRFDVVLLDLTVSGGMGGVETAARLKEIDPSARLIVSSGYSDTLALSDFHRYGFEASLPKPWTIPQVSEVFRNVIAPSATEPSSRRDPGA